MRGPVLIVGVEDRKTGVRYLARASLAWKQVKIYKEWQDVETSNHEVFSASRLQVVSLALGHDALDMVFFTGAPAFHAFLLRYAYKSPGAYHAHVLPVAEGLSEYARASLLRADAKVVAAMRTLSRESLFIARPLTSTQIYTYRQLVDQKPYADYTPDSYYATYAIVAEEKTLKIGMCKGDAAIETRLAQYLVHVPIVRALVVIFVPVKIKQVDAWFKNKNDKMRLRSLSGQKTEWLGFSTQDEMRAAVVAFEEKIGAEGGAIWRLLKE